MGFYFKIFVLIFCPIILYWNELNLVFNEALKNDLSTHIIAIPFMILYLIYRERDYLRAVISSQITRNQDSDRLVEGLAGVIIFAIAYMLKLYGSTTFFSMEYHVFSIPILVIGLILMVYGSIALRALAFHVAMLFFLIPPPFLLAQRIGFVLATFSAYASFNFIKLLGLPVYLSSEYTAPVIYLTSLTGESIPFAIDIGCSGIYSLIGFIIFAIFLSYISQGTINSKLLVLVAGIPVIYFLNIARVTLILIVGYFGGVDIALNLFHLLGGWTLILLGSFFLLNMAERVLNVRILTFDVETCEHSNSIDKTHCMTCGRFFSRDITPIKPSETLKLTLITLAVILLSTIRIPVFTLSTVTSEIYVGEINTLEIPVKILPDIQGYDLRFVFRDTQFENISKQEASLMYRYQKIDPERENVWIAVEIASTKAACHPWEACLITYAGVNRVTQVDLRDISLSEAPPISARYFVFKEDDVDRIQVILYWYTLSTFKTSGGYEDKWVKLSIITYVNSRDAVVQAENMLLPFAENISAHWQPVQSWSPIILSFAQNGLLFISLFMFALIGLTGYALHSWIRKRQDAKRLLNRITDPVDKDIIATLGLFQEGSCEEKILEKYEEISGRTINMDTLTNKLRIAQEMGLVDRKIVKIYNFPHLIWKSNL